MLSPIAKTKKCKICHEPFTFFNSLAKVCSVPCSIEWVNREKIRREASHKRFLRAEMKIARERIKTKSEHAREAQQAFNRFIRLRDKSAPCISCQRFHTGQYHAGHYRTVRAAPELRFNELNCHKQCSACNNYLSGNILEYRKNLISKLGIEQVEKLDGPHDPKHYSIEDLKSIKAQYSKLCRELEKGQQNA